MADESKKYVSGDNLKYTLQQLKTKLDETYSTIEYVDKTVPQVLGETILATVTAEEVAAVAAATEGNGMTLGTYLKFEVDAFECIEGETLLIQYQQLRQYFTVYPSGENVNLYTVDLYDSDYVEGWTLPENQAMIFLTKGKNKNGELDESKWYIRGNFHTTNNITDITIRRVECVAVDSRTLEEDVEIKRSLSMGRVAGDIPRNSVALGEHVETATPYSMAVGNDAHALGNCSFSFGTQCKTTGNFALTIGHGNLASGNYSAAIGRQNKAEGGYAHAFGYKTTATGTYGPHAEGAWTTASGNSSHAEGSGTHAKASASHTEGDSTIANCHAQHAEGKYNIEDTANKYLHIAGNGTADAARSNAHTLDWSGNGWFAGNVSVDGTPTNDNDLTTKAYVDNALTIDETELDDMLAEVYSTTE